jgi:hypothetical protein
MPVGAGRRHASQLRSTPAAVFHAAKNTGGAVSLIPNS